MASFVNFPCQGIVLISELFIEFYINNLIGTCSLISPQFANFILFLSFGFHFHASHFAHFVIIYLFIHYLNPMMKPAQKKSPSHTKTAIKPITDRAVCFSTEMKKLSYNGLNLVIVDLESPLDLKRKGEIN